MRKKRLTRAHLYMIQYLLVGILLTLLVQCKNPNEQKSEMEENQPAESNQNPINYSILPDLPEAPATPEPYEFSTIPLPENVYDAKLVNYLPDYEHLIVEVRFWDDMTSNLAVMKEDGSDFKCLTCGLDEEIGGEMPVPLPDGKTVYTPTGVLECSPSIVDCREAKILPLVYPEISGAKTLARIATNMSPDGIHVAYTLVTTRMLPLVLMSELTRVSDEKGERYVLANTKVIAGEDMLENGDNSSFRAYYAGNGEVKHFTSMGRELMTISSFEANNFDLAKIDLSTGEVSRFTKHFSYDEGVYPSPDGEWVIFQSLRHTRRMDAFGLIPRPLVAGFGISSGMAEYRNQWVTPNKNSGDDRRRFYGLSMVDKHGDRARIPEDGYTGQNLFPEEHLLDGYTHFGNFSWHINSTHGVFWQQKDHMILEKGERPGRLQLLRFTSRKPTAPLEIFTPKLAWATDLADLQPFDVSIPAEGKIMGKVAGYAEISVDSSRAEEPMFRIEYYDFTDDGEYILNGYEERTNKTFTRDSHWFADIQVSGKRQGYLKAEDVRFYQEKIGSGTIEAKLGNYEISVDLAKGLPTGVPGELK